MARSNVQRNDGKWACFSSISDSFITKFMDEKRYEAWMKKEYGRAGYKPLKECHNKMTVDDCIFSITLNRTVKESIAELKLVGLATPENIANVEVLAKEFAEERENE